MGSRTRRTDFQPWVSGFRFWRAKGFYFGLHFFFFFTQGPSSAAISQNHHLYLVLLLLLLPGASWLESHALLCQSPPCYADFLARLYLELPGVAGYWSQKLQCAAKGTWLPWVLPVPWRTSRHVISRALPPPSHISIPAREKNVDPWNSSIKLLLLGKTLHVVRLSLFL